MAHRSVGKSAKRGQFGAVYTRESDPPRPTHAEKSEPGHRNGKRFFISDQRPHGANAPSTDEWKLIHCHPRRSVARRRSSQATGGPTRTRDRLIHYFSTENTMRVPGMCTQSYILYGLIRLKLTTPADLRLT